LEKSVGVLSLLELAANRREITYDMLPSRSWDSLAVESLLLGTEKFGHDLLPGSGCIFTPGFALDRANG
jgi:hypothetical protein